MFISRPTHANDLSTHVAITMDLITAGQKEVASFCASTTVVAYSPKKHVTGRAVPVDDLSWWKPFLQLRGPERITGPAEATRLFNRSNVQSAAEKDICIDHSEYEAPSPSFNAGSTSVFTSMRNRNQVVMPAYNDDPDDSESTARHMPDAYVIAERVTAPVELRFFPQRTARAPTIVDC